MPIDIPPLPPQQADPAVLEQRVGQAGQGDVVDLTINGIRMLISGNTYLSEQRIRTITGISKTPSQVILLLTALYTADGYLFVNVQYARSGNTIYVLVNEGYPQSVDAPPALKPFFASLEGKRGLRESDVERRRVLAELKSERAGYAMSGNYQVNPKDPEAFTLIVKRKPIPDHHPLSSTSSFGNPGNRFLGRYFGSTQLGYAAPNGDKLSLGYTHGFTNLGSSNGGRNYNNGQLAYATINRFGLYGLSGSYTEYDVDNLFDTSAIIQNDRVNGKIIKGRLEGNQFLYADGKVRWLLQEQFAYVNSKIEIEDGDLIITVQSPQQQPGLLDGLAGGLLGNLFGGLLGLGGANQGPQTQTVVLDAAGTNIQDEEYGTARLGTTVSRSFGAFSNDGSISAGFGYKQSLGGRVDSPLSDPRRSADFGIFDATIGAKYELPWNTLINLDINGQLSNNNRLPQQQQWVLGGPEKLSAYLPGVLVGDTGFFGHLSWQLPAWSLVGVRYRFSLFFEGGASRFEDADGTVGDLRSVTDAGLKLELQPFDWLALTGYVARGITDANVPQQRLDDTEANVFFTVKAEF